MHVTAIVVAAGEGHRIGGTVPKPYLPLVGRPMILRTLDRCFTTCSIDEIVLVVAGRELARCEALLQEDTNLRHRPWRLQSGGSTRQQSVKRGLEKIDTAADIIVIHDGARPLVSPRLIDQCVELTCEKNAVVVGVPVRDTIKLVSQDHWVRSTPDRNSLWEIQTPQVFRRDLIVETHHWAIQKGIEATDDAMLVEQMGKPVFVVEGHRSNLKVTVPEDVLLVEALIRASNVQ